MLRRVDWHRRRADTAVAIAILDDLFDYVLGAPAVTESELRLLDGNR
jgi:hypothetical protein